MFLGIVTGPPLSSSLWLIFVLLCFSSLFPCFMLVPFLVNQFLSHCLIVSSLVSQLFFHFLITFLSFQKSTILLFISASIFFRLFSFDLFHILYFPSKSRLILFFNFLTPFSFLSILSRAGSFVLIFFVIIFSAL